MKLLLTTTLIIAFLSSIATNPVLHFSDIVSGPRIGNTDGVNGLASNDHGTVITIWGNYLGNTQSTSKIYIEDALNNVVEAAHVYYWKNADGALPGGPSDLFTYHQMQEIAFSIPAGVDLGNAKIYVEVNSINSNELDFLVRDGNIYFIDNAGNDSTGDGTFANPWKTLDHVANPINAKLVKGDIIYLLDYISTAKIKIGSSTPQPYIGDDTHPFSIISFPGNYDNYMSNVLNPTASNRNVNKNVCLSNHWGQNSHWNFSKLKLETNENGIHGFFRMRVVGNEFFGPYAEGTGGTLSGNGDAAGGGLIFGNYAHDFGDIATSSLHHTFYLSNRDGTPNETYEFGWNHLANNGAVHGFHIFDQSTCGDWTGTFRIHDNVVLNQRDCMVHFQGSCSAGQGGFTYDAEVYNNIFINDPTSDYSGTPLCLNSTMLTGTVNFYNNLIYGFGVQTDNTPKAININNQFPGTSDISNNIFLNRYDHQGGYLNGVNPTAASTNIFYDYSVANLVPPAWTNSINAAPIFVDLMNNDFRLTTSSEGVDAGLTKSLLYDLFGHSRPQGTIDIGPFETMAVVLPIELLSFRGFEKASKVILEWLTSSETNNKGFEIQRSVDGQTFEKIGWRNGNGTSIQQEDYFFEDENVLSEQKYYYRLRQLDFNGQSTFSKIITIQVKGENQISIFPNPFSNHIYISSKKEISTVSIQLLNSVGQFVFSEIKTISGQTPVGINNLPTGVYEIMLIENERIVYRERIVKRK